LLEFVNDGNIILFVLQMMADEGQFREAANLLDAVKQFLGHFEQYKHISVIADLLKRIDRIKKDLTRQIKRMFAELAQVCGSNFG
jgi:hypothetical protein